MTLHNLATVNYIELLDFQESPEHLTELHQQLSEVEAKKRSD